MCGSSPKPDPAIGRAAQENAAIARDAFNLSKEQYEYEKAQWEKFAPYYDEMFKSSLEDAATGRERSAFAWDRYLKQGVPLEDQIVRDARTYDSPEEVRRREGLAAATVQSQIEAQTADTTRELGRIGVSAARAGQQLTTDKNDMALAKVGAVNNERNNAQLTGIALRQGAAGLTSALPGQTMAFQGAANQSQGAAQGTVGAGQSFRAGGLSMLNSGAGLAIQGNNSAASILNQQYQNQVQSSNSRYGALGAIAGAGLSMFTGGSKPWWM